MKKILVEVNEAYLEACRKSLERRWGVSVSNSQLVSHLLFLHHDTQFEEAMMSAKQILSQKSKNKELKFNSTSPAEPRTPIRSLMDAYKETKK